jgi:hypothetical protein
MQIMSASQPRKSSQPIRQPLAHIPRHPFIYPSIYLSIYPSIHPSIHPSHPSTHPHRYTHTYVYRQLRKQQRPSRTQFFEIQRGCERARERFAFVGHTIRKCLKMDALLLNAIEFLRHAMTTSVELQISAASSCSHSRRTRKASAGITRQKGSTRQNSPRVLACH